MAQTQPINAISARIRSLANDGAVPEEQDNGKLITAAIAGLGAIYRDGYRYKKAGVMLVNLVKADTVGSGLFDKRDDPRALSRMKLLDGLNARFGRDAITFGQTASQRPWSMRNDMLSQRYTTDWDELLIV